MDPREQIIQNLLGKTVHVEIDRPIGYRHGDIRYPVNYGYISGLMAADAEEQDAYILGVSEPITAFDGRVIGAVRRKNDCEDKLVVAPEGMSFHQGQIAEAVHFQEQFFDTYIISLFHKSCGVIPYRWAGREKEFLIVYEQLSKTWSLPKGHMEAGETEEETALRELAEETGLTAVLDSRSSTTVTYPISAIARKQVVYFPGEVSGVPKVRAGEIEKYCWVKADSLKNYLHPDTVKACACLLGLSNPEIGNIRT